MTYVSCCDLQITIYLIEFALDSKFRFEQLRLRSNLNFWYY